MMHIFDDLKRDFGRDEDLLSVARRIAAEQAKDDGLWFVAETCAEAYLQAALRRLTAAIEGTL